jgi:hypothetical protein
VDAGGDLFRAGSAVAVHQAAASMESSAVDAIPRAAR